MDLLYMDNLMMYDVQWAFKIVLLFIMTTQNAKYFSNGQKIRISETVISLMGISS